MMYRHHAQDHDTDADLAAIRAVTAARTVATEESLARTWARIEAARGPAAPPRRARFLVPVGAAAMVAAVALGAAVVLETGDDPVDGISPGSGSWQDQAAAIEGIETYDEPALDPVHLEGSISYDVLPPVGGPHNNQWQDCTGVVYGAQIANEYAVHSLEHGAVWITYDPSLPDSAVAALADRVNGADKVFMSPFPGLNAPISLQAWGYRLVVDRADDPRIDEFVRVLRDVAGPEAGVAPCGGPQAITTTGTLD